MKPSPLPQTAVPYHQLLRGPRRRWWKPMLSLLVVVGLGGTLLILISGAGELVDGLGLTALGEVSEDLSPLSMLTLDLMLASLIVVAGLATWIVHRIRPRYVSSVSGGIRWRWLARCLMIITPVWVLYMLIGTLTDPPASGRPDQWILLLAMAVLITPFQAAGEEYLFRGWLVQNVSAYFAHPAIGLTASTMVSAALFSLAHGSFDPWVIANISTLAVAACLTNWRTGGLEAGIAMHVVNNVAVGVVTITIGGYADSFVSEATTGTAVEVAIGLVVHAIAVALILWQARRTGVQRLYRPTAIPEVARAPENTNPPAPPAGVYVLANDRPIWTAPLG
ncbi:MAG TPA: CPBP family intramembrane glutamic endopeptidase [Propionibacteriaceae bacterium]